MHTVGRVMCPGDGWILDKGAVSDIEGGVGFAPYVDNANFVSTGEGLVQNRLDCMTAVLDELGLVWHEKVDACDEVEILGVVVDGRRGLIRAKPARVWRLWCGVGALLRRRRAS